jgi:hypothetical protein
MPHRHPNSRHHVRWKDTIDYETFWILTFSAAVLGSGILALLSFAQNNPNALRDTELRGVTTSRSGAVDGAAQLTSRVPYVS